MALWHVIFIQNLTNKKKLYYNNYYNININNKTIR